MVDNVIIMAGGAGKRLWPASMGNKPKQFMQLGRMGTLFYQTVQRAFGLGIRGNVYVVIHENYLEEARLACKGINKEQKERLIFLAEPASRNTAPALAFASAFIREQGLNKQMSLVLAADHLISPLESFRQSVELAANAAAEGCIVTFGIRPLEPNTGYGYVEAADIQDGGNVTNTQVYQVLSFREKPDEANAQKYVDSGRYYWNAGIFAYRNDCFEREMFQCEPAVSGIFSTLRKEDFEKVDSGAAQGPYCYRASNSLKKLYNNCLSISIDYAMMERSQKVRMVRSEFEWSDLGSWDVIAGLGYETDSAVYSYDSDNNFVYSDSPVALCGVSNLMVVVRNGRVLVCRRGSSQLVRKAAEDDKT